MAQKFITIGNSVGLVIPQAIRDEVGIGKGDSFSLDYTAQKIIVTPIKKKKKNRTGVNTKFAQMVDKFIEEHKDVLSELAKK